MLSCINGPLESEFCPLMKPSDNIHNTRNLALLIKSMFVRWLVTSASHKTMYLIKSKENVNSECLLFIIPQ